MKVLLDKRKKLYLESDAHNYMINKYSGKKDKNGNEIYQTLCYAGKIEHAIKYLYELKLRESTATSMKELIEDHKQIIKEIKELFNTEGLIND